ncbi:hypothetical protein H4S06_003092, partial [Coemansia sp. BCRC 34490]
MCLVCKRGWMSAIERLWMWPRPDSLENLIKLSAIISHRPMFKIREHSRYGSLVKTLDFGVIFSQWEEIESTDIFQPIISSCTNIRTLDLNMCKIADNPSFVKLFADNSQLCNSLTNLEITYVEASDMEIEALVRLFPRLKRLLIA